MNNKWEKEIKQIIKDFYTDRCRYDEHNSPFESTMEIYDNYTNKLKDFIRLQRQEAQRELLESMPIDLDVATESCYKIKKWRDQKLKDLSDKEKE